MMLLMLGQEGLVVIGVLLQPGHKGVAITPPQGGRCPKTAPRQCVVLEQRKQPGAATAAPRQHTLDGEDLREGINAAVVLDVPECARIGVIEHRCLHC